jgi:hypothetical protein
MPLALLVTVSRLVPALAAVARRRGRVMFLAAFGTGAVVAGVVATGRPNLIVSGLVAPAGLREGACNVFDVTIENLEAEGTAQTITVLLHLQYANQGQARHIKVLPGIAPRGQSGAVHAVRFDTVTLPTLGRVSYTATVNPDGVVPETVVDERNSAAGSGVIAGPCASPIAAVQSPSSTRAPRRSRP